MIITKHVIFEKEIEIELSKEDFESALTAGDVESRMDALKAVNQAAKLFSAVPDRIIEAMLTEQRRVIAKYLRDQASRFDFTSIKETP